MEQTKNEANQGSMGCLELLAIPMVFALLGGALYLFGQKDVVGLIEYLQGPKRYKRRPITRKSKPLPKSFCPSIIQDLNFLEALFSAVSDKDYKPTPAKCKQMTSLVNRRFSTAWLRRVASPLYQQGEHPISTAARTVAVSGVEIVLTLACEKAKAKGQKRARYHKNFRAHTRGLRKVCK